MSKEVDERVVSMQFDNGQFEKNVQTSLSTIDKLKKSLNFEGASKGLEGINAAARNVNMSVLGEAVDGVKQKFTAMEIIGITALTNLTNSAMNAGKRIVNALTLEPVTTGFQEYETQINATQTIMANTQKEGATIEDVNAALDELNKYADLTIYNFTEMTRNIGTFTAAGVDLKTSVSAIQGIANLAAVSGSTSQQASVAMYQLSQALASGTVKLQDWNSVVNAGMGGQIFQDALRKTSEELKTGAEEAIKAEGSFRESLTKGWLTSQVLTETLKKFTTSGANEYVANYTGLTKEAIEAELDKVSAIKDENVAIDKASEAIANMSGKSKEEIKQALQFARTAEDAATKVKTFSQLWDVLKEAAQSGWSASWRLIVGDFEQAKALFTPLADFLTNIINGISDARNAVLEVAMNSPFAKIMEKVNNVTAATKKVTEATQDYADIVQRVINGELGHTQERWNKLTEMGYNWAKVQNMVNEELGNSVRHDENLSAQEQGLNEVREVTIDQLLQMTDAQLKELDLTDDEISSLRSLQKTAEKAGYSLKQVMDNPDLLNGRNLMIDGFKRIANGLTTIFYSIRRAWVGIFHPDSSEEKGMKLFNLLASFRGIADKFATTMSVNAGKLTRTFKGLFAVIDLVRTILGGGFRLAFKIASTILGAFNLNVLDVTAYIGDLLVKFHDFVLENNIVAKAIRAVADKLPDIIEKVKEWITAFMNLPIVQKVINGVVSAVTGAYDSFSNAISNFITGIQDGSITISGIFETIKNSISSFIERIPILNKIVEFLKPIISDAGDIGKNIIQGLINGIKDTATSLPDVLINIGKTIIQTIKDILGIHSPSKEMYQVGEYVVEGLSNGIESKSSSVLEKIKAIGSSIIEYFKNFNWGSIVSILVSGGILFVGNKFADAINTFVSPLEGVGSVLSGVGNILDGAAKPIAKVIKNFAKIEKAFAGLMKGISFKFKAEGLLDIAKAIGILVIAVYALSKIPAEELWPAVGALASIIALLGGLALVMSRLGSGQGGGIKIAALGAALMEMGAAMLIVALAMKLIGGMNEGSWQQAITGLIAVVGGFAAIIATYGYLVKGEAAENISKLGTLAMKLGVAMLMIVGAIKLAGTLNEDCLTNAGMVASGFLGMLVAMTAIVKWGEGAKIDEFGGLMVKMAIAMGLMVLVAKFAGTLTPEQMLGGTGLAIAFLAFIWALTKITKEYKKGQLEGLGKSLIAIAGAMAILALIVKMLGKMELDNLKKGLAGVLALSGVILVLVAIVKYLGSDAPKIASTILALSVAIGILGGVAVLLGLIDESQMKKGLKAVAVLSVLMAGLVFVTKYANDCKGNLIVMTVAIGVMAAAVAALSFIRTDKLIAATGALAVLMGMFALIIYSSKDASKSFASLIVMTVAIGVLGGLLYLIAQLPIANCIVAAVSLSVLLLAMTGAMAIINAMGGISPLAAVSLALIAAVVSQLADVIAKLSEVDTVPAMINTGLLIALIAAMTAVCVAMSAVPVSAAVQGALSFGAFVGIMEVILLALGGLSKIPGVKELTESGGELLASIGYAIGNFVGSIVGGIGAGLTSGLPDMANNLSAFMDNLQPFIEGAKSIDGSVLDNIGTLSLAILALCGADLIAGITKFLSFGSTFTMLGTELGNFMTSAKPFIDGAKKIKAGSMDGVMELTKVIMMLTASELLDGISKWFTGSSSLSKFAQELYPFGMALIQFSNLLSEHPINNEAVQSAANAGSIMAALSKELPSSGGVLQKIIGEKDMGKFSKQLYEFGMGMIQFSNLVGYYGINQEAVQAAANAGSIMAAMSKELPSTGGVLQWIMGEKSMSSFGTQLYQFGEGITKFSNLVNENPINQEAVQDAANAGSIMAELQDKLPSSGGVVQWFLGDSDMGVFGEQLYRFGMAMVQFSNLVGFYGINSEAITAAANAADIMIELQSGLENTGGVFEWFTGSKDLSNFGKQLYSFGEGIVDFSNVLSEGNLSMSSMGTAVSIASSILRFSEKLKENDTSNLSNFKAKDLGTAIKEYYDKISNIDSSVLSMSVTNAIRLANLINDLSSIDTSGVSSYVSALNTLGQAKMDGFVESFNSSAKSMSSVGEMLVSSMADGMKTKSSTLTNLGKSMVTQICQAIMKQSSAIQASGILFITRLVLGISTNKAKVSSAIASAVSSAVSKARSYYGAFYNVGKYLVDGFANGIRANQYAAVAKANAMANAAAEAARRTLAIHSPSKVFYKIGSYAGLGFVNSLGDYADRAKSAGSELADSAKFGLGNAIATVYDMLNGDMDMQPTIRPVVDLSDVESGVSSISSLFAGSPTVGAFANVRAVGSMMSRYGQNGNSEVVSAIDKLRRDLGNVGNTSYNINGITYSNGSEVSDAIETLVRAARVERRR